MKKATLLLALSLISALGFSQNKQHKKTPKPEIGVILNTFEGLLSFDAEIDARSRLKNPKNNHLIDEINKLEFEYLKLKSKEVQYEFVNRDLSKLKTKDQIFKEYIAYLKKKIAEEKPNQTKTKQKRLEKLKNKFL